MNNATCRFHAAGHHRTICRPEILALLTWLTLSMTLLPAPAFAQPAAPVFEHRVVVATTSMDRELDVEESLLRNVNRLAALGFEIGAFVGGDGAMINRMLHRSPLVIGQVDHAGHVFVIMNRPVGQPSPVREYRMLHARHELGVEKIVQEYAREGFRLTVTAWEGGIFHAAFERQEGGSPVEYRVFRTERRRGWPSHMLADPEVARRVQRVIPMFLQAALVELGEPADTPAEFTWLDAPASSSFRMRSPLAERAKEGFRVQILRLRGNEVDIGLLKPAGATGPAPALKLDDGPWGSACDRGIIRGADAHAEGRVFCVAEDPQGPVRNRGFELNLRPEQEKSDGDLFRGWLPCEVRLQMSSSRPASARIARALQLEAELNYKKIEPGYRIIRAFAAPRENNDDLLIFVTTRIPLAAFSGPAAPAGPAPRLTVEVDGLLQSSLARNEAAINERLHAELGPLDIIAWAEVNDQRGSRSVRLAGCARTQFNRDHAESVLRGILVRTAYSDYRIRNEIIVELIR